MSDLPAQPADLVNGETKGPPCALAVYGASGDLTARKLLPAIAALQRHGQLDDRFGLIGVGRSALGDDGFRAHCRDAVPDGGDGWATLLENARWVQGDYGDPATAASLRAAFEAVEAERNTAGNRLIYLASPPSTFGPVAGSLAAAGLGRAVDGGFTRLVVEKPFGTDGASARDLDIAMHAAVAEGDLYRIDHYLGKETVQNILALRFANAIFEPVWDRRYVDHVQVTVAESLGVGERAGFYEHAGALRDIVQNHLMQVLAVAAMEPPSSMDATGVRDEKVKALRSVRILEVDEVEQWAHRGQYDAGVVDGHEVLGYRQEEGVAPDSQTNTYVAAELELDSWRWAGVPFYIRTGKRMPRRVTEVAFTFKSVPHLAFPGRSARGLHPNVLVVRIQPDEGISLRFGVKRPGGGFTLTDATMEFSYAESFGAGTRDAYERLLLDAMLGDPTLFIRSDEVAQAWKIVDPIARAWAGDCTNGPLPLHRYASGTWGPKEADRLLNDRGHRWATT